MELLEGLNEAQKEAVTHEQGPLLIVAGAGTGKTTVIARRIAWLIDSGKANMDHILALTFTDKAAAEMDERVGNLLPIGYSDLWISTFHAFGERLLHQHALDIGVPHDFKLLTETEQWLLVRKHLNKFPLNYYRPLGNPTKFIHALLRHFSRAKDEEIYPENYLAYAEQLRLNKDDVHVVKAKRSKRGTVANEVKREGEAVAPLLMKGTTRVPVDENDPNEAARVEEVANAYHVYQQLLLDENALDFGDLINYTLKLLRSRPEILASYREQFKYILVDEFQDTNWAQYELIKLLAAPDNNITVVGDDDQAIYRFRGASMSNILQFKKDYPSTASVVLTENYRSSQNILDLTYGFIQHNNPNRLEVTLADHGAPLIKKLHACTSDVADIQHLSGVTFEDEYALVIQKIKTLKALDPETQWRDFAILARSNDQANLFDSALADAGLPHQSYTSKGLYGKPVIIDALSYLRLLDNYHESTALWRVLNMPLWEISPRALIELSHWATKKSISLFAALEQCGAIPGTTSETVRRINSFLHQVSELTLFAREHKPTEILVRCLNDIGYTTWIEKKNEATARVEFSFLNQFYQRLKRWEETQTDPRLRDFIETIAYEMESGEQGALSIDPETGPDVIRVMTVHAAKGLEFTYVFVVGLVDQRFPTRQRREQIEMPEALIKEILPEGNIHLEEERRLFYVAMTRARRGLYLTSAQDYAGARKKKPSLFLTELDLTLQEPLSLVKRDQFVAPQTTEQTVVDIRQFIPQRYSFSQLKAYQTCPFQYRFAHVLKVPVWGRHTFSFGTSMHLALQRFFELIVERRASQQHSLFDQSSAVTMPSVAELLKIFEESWIDDWYDNEAHRREYYAQGKKILEEFYAKHAGQWPETKYLEEGFTLKIGPYSLVGKIDRVDAKDGGVEIIDYKTGNVPDSIDDVDKDQLLIYQMAAELIWHEKPVALTFYYLNENKPLSFVGTPVELEKVQQKIVKTIEKINEGDFAATPSPNVCKFCDFKDICEFRKL